MNNRLFVISFFLILLVGFILRIYNISNVPPGVNQDEASIGYTAYSLLETGRDEYGVSFPLSFQSFGDWKLPVYVYTTIPFVKVLGLSETAVRLPSVIFGFATLILTYFLAKYLFVSKTIALFAMAILAVSPWHLHLSRVESESNVAVFLITLSTVLLLKSFKGGKWLLLPSFIGFALTYYTYAGNYIFTTIFLLGIFLLYKKQLLLNKFLKVGTIILFILILFISIQTVFSANKTKLSGISIFSDPAISHTDIELPRIDHEDQVFIGKLLHNKAMLGVERFIQNYINSYSPEFLFIKGGDNKAHNIPNFGNMYLIEIIPFILGFIILFIQRKKRESKLLLFWLLIAPIAASITKDAPHTNRMFAVFPALSIVLALGLSKAFLYFKKPGAFKKLLLFVFIALYIANIGIYLDRYHVHFPRNEAQSWGLPYKALLNEINQEKYKDRKVVFARPEASHYIFLLFYSRYNPQIYQNSVARYAPTNDKFIHVKEYDRFEFRDIDWSKDLVSGNKLFIDFTKDIPPVVEIGKYRTLNIALPNEKPIFTIVEGR